MSLSSQQWPLFAVIIVRCFEQSFGRFVTCIPSHNTGGLCLGVQGAGLKLEDALAFWRAEFSQKVICFSLSLSFSCPFVCSSISWILTKGNVLLYLSFSWPFVCIQAFPRLSLNPQYKKRWSGDSRVLLPWMMCCLYGWPSICSFRRGLASLLLGSPQMAADGSGEIWQRVFLQRSPQLWQRRQANGQFSSSFSVGWLPFIMWL